MAVTEEQVRSVCLSYIATEERLSHGHPAWFIAGKRQFASCHASGHHDLRRPHLWCAAPEGAQAALVGQRPDVYFRPPYVGHRGWLGVYLDSVVTLTEVEGLLIEAYRAVAPARMLAAFDRELAEGSRQDSA